MRKVWLFVIGAAVCALALPAASLGHAERESFFPDPALGSVPKYRTSGPSLVVCKSDSRRRIKRNESGATERRNLRLLRRCRYRHIQAAVNAAQSNYRILVLPGVYREEPSRAVENDPQECHQYKEGGGGIVPIEPPAEDAESAPTYDYHWNCPNAKNLIAVLGDDPNDPDRVCDQRCNLQIEGTGAKRTEVTLLGCERSATTGLCVSRRKENIIRADRADGIHVRNMQLRYSDFNNVYFLETNGFRISKVLTRWSREYGVLSFTSDNGLYDDVEAYGSGDSGVYPGSGPEGHCNRYGIEMRKVNSHHNAMGHSGTAANGVYIHDSKFHHNATGIVTDSFVPNHPGMPQDCSRFESNRIYSNNAADVYSEERDEYCRRDPEQRDPRIVCPAFPLPVGTGVLLAGGNGNLYRDNEVYDNWRAGFMQFHVPSVVRGETDPTKQTDTSHQNQYLDNHFGVRPAVFRTIRSQRGGRTPAFTGAVRRVQVSPAQRDPNGLDVWWDEQGSNNCFAADNDAGMGLTVMYDPAELPECPAVTPFTATGEPNPIKVGFHAICASWDPHTNDDPPGCRTEGSNPGNNNGGWRAHWFDAPPEPK